MVVGEADEGAPGQGIHVGGALAGEVGQEEEPVGPRRDLGRLLAEDLVSVGTVGQPADPPQPAQGEPRGEDGRQDVPHARRGVDEDVQPGVRGDGQPLRSLRWDEGKEDLATAAHSHRAPAWGHQAIAHGLGWLVPAAGHHRDARPQAQLLRRSTAQLPGHLRGGQDRRQQVGRQPRPLQDLLRPLQLRDVEDARPRGVARVRGHLAGHLQAHEVLGQEHRVGLPQQLRPVFLEPE